jgi:O-antigen/teichoic acid export membrane protein
MAATLVIEQASSQRSQRFLINVFWNWSHVAITLFSAVILSRYIIRRLGAEGYGLWQLSYSMIGYYGLLDLGFRSAVVYYSARYRAREEYESLNELLSTLLVYFSAIGILLVGATFLLSNQVHRLFPVSPEHRDAFTKLVLIIGISIASGIVFNVFSGLVEGFQRFDLANQARIVSFVIRYFGCALLLYFGYGLVAMGVIALIAQFLLNGLYIVITRRIFPDFRFSFKLVRVRAWKETASYGIHTFVASMANTTLEQGPSLVIGHIRGGAFVGYYNLPLRILQYAADAVSRVGIVVAAQAAELAANGRLDIVAKLGIYANRYCFTLYTPLAIVVLVYGRELIQLWIGAEYVTNSVPLLPVFLAGAALAMAGQFSSSTILFGIGRHRGYAYWLLMEAAANIIAMAVLVPRYGLFAAAVASTSLMILVRGIITPILACRQLDYPFIAYMRSIFISPVLTALPVLILICSCKFYLWPGRTWLDLISASLVTVILYWGAAYFTCLEAEHRSQLWEWVRRRAFK